MRALTDEECKALYLTSSNSKLQILGAKRANSVGFVTKTSLFLSFFIGRKSQCKGEIRGESAIGYQCSLYVYIFTRLAKNTWPFRMLASSKSYNISETLNC